MQSTLSPEIAAYIVNNFTRGCFINKPLNLVFLLYSLREPPNHSFCKLLWSEASQAKNNWSRLLNYVSWNIPNCNAPVLHGTVSAK